MLCCVGVAVAGNNMRPFDRHTCISLSPSGRSRTSFFLLRRSRDAYIRKLGVGLFSHPPPSLSPYPPNPTTFE